MKFMYRPVKKNFFSRGKNPKALYLVIHDTGNTAAGANVLNHENYVGTNSRKASVHYFVDDNSIVQFVGDSLAAHAVGDGHGKYGIANQNSLNVEMCINFDGDCNKTYKNIVELTKNLMKKFNIPFEKAVCHHDASRKNCPGYMSGLSWKVWWQFKEDIGRPIEWEIDLSKDSDFGGAKATKDYTGHWAEDSIKRVMDKGLIVGDGQDNFRLDDEITCVEVAVTIDKLVDTKK